MRIELAHFENQLSRFVLGLPALLLILCVAVLAEQHRHGALNLPRKYSEAAANALHEQDWAAAGVYYRKLAWLDESDPSGQYGLALIAERRGDMLRAVRLMSNIAPADRMGYDKAHVWLAQQYLAATQAAAGNRELATAHLLHALKQNPDNPKAHHLFGQICFVQSRGQDRELLEPADAHLQRSCATYPDDRLTLATVLGILGANERAQQHVTELIAGCIQQLETDPTNIEVHLRLVRAHIVVKQFAEAVHWLQKEIRETDDKRLKSELATVCFNWVRYLAQTRKHSLPEQLDLFEIALNADPGNEAVLRNLTEMARRHQSLSERPGANKEQDESVIEEIEADGIN